ncbi:MAG: hypothetical protein QOE56_2568 [Solirubrobacterales bacterium]|jgi:hypothetical protein|nr:hypothetical protein [Solirubrobacterales bacterium]
MAKLRVATRLQLWVVFMFAVLATTAVASVVARAAPGAEVGNEPSPAAKESSGSDGFDVGTVIDAVASIGVPLALAAAGFAGGVFTDRRRQKREYNKEQLGYADDFLAASGKVVRSLESFADGQAGPDDVAPLREELYGVAESSTKITDEEIKGLGREFYKRTVDVINAVGRKGRSTKDVARDAVDAFDQLRRGVERFRCDLAPVQKRAVRKGAEYQTASPPPSRVEPASSAHAGEGSSEENVL